MISIAACVLELAAQCNFLHCCCSSAGPPSHFALFAYDHSQHVNTNSNHKPITITQFELACTWPCLLVGQHTSVTTQQQHAKNTAPARDCAHVQELNQCRSCHTGKHAGTLIDTPNHSCRFGVSAAGSNRLCVPTAAYDDITSDLSWASHQQYPFAACYHGTQTPCSERCAPHPIGLAA